MKKIIPLLIVLLITSCGSQKSEFKLITRNNNHFKIQYPNTWIDFGKLGHVYLMPKALRKMNTEDELNHISVTRNIINAEKFEGVENTLITHRNALMENELNKESKLLKLVNDSKYLYKIESLVTYKSTKAKYKRAEFFYAKNKRLDYIMFQMREDLYNKYINEAMLIINSFEPK